MERLPRRSPPRRIAAALALACAAPLAARGADAIPTPAPAALAPQATGESPGAGPAAPEGPVGVLAGEAPLTVSRRHVTTFRAPFLGVSPAARAQRAEQVLEERLRQPGAVTFTVQREPQGHTVLVDGLLAFVLTERDADRLAGQTLEQASRAALGRLELVAAESAEGRDREQMGRAALRTGVATGLLLLLLGAVGLARRRLVPRLAGVGERAARLLTVGGAPLVGAERLRAAARGLALALTWLVSALGAYRWLSYALLQFPATRPWGEHLSAFFAGVAERLLGGVLGALPDLLVAGLILLLAHGVVRVVRPLFDRVEAGRASLSWLDADSARPTRRLFSLAVWIFAVVMAYPYLPGSQSEAFKGMSVLVGLVVTFGGSSVFGQAASGLILMYSRTLRVGEYVRVDGHEGTVVELGTFTTRILTGLGEEVSLPNALVLGTVTKNYSRAVRGRGYVVDTTVSIGYDTPWRQVEALLVEAARRTPGVLPDPAPRVFQTELSDFYPAYRLVCQAAPSEPSSRAEVLTRLHAHIQDVFNEYGVQIMSPHYLGDPARAKVVPRGGWWPPPAVPPRGDGGGPGQDGA